jgi:hypothetical protein
MTVVYAGHLAAMVIVSQNRRVNRIPRTNKNPRKTSIAVISPPFAPAMRLRRIHRDI